MVCIKFHFTLRTLHQKFMKCLKKLLVTKLQFRHGKALVEDCKHSDHPSTDSTVGKTEEVSKIITQD